MNIFKCNKCGKVIEILEGGCPAILCCGEKMTELKANTVDAAKEKHVPFTKINNDKVVATVGEVTHPMEEKHYIGFIACDFGDKIVRKQLKPGQKPEATFCYKKGMKIYAYCNLHGLWVCEL